MKTALLILLALTTIAAGQTPAPSTPAPFDALHIAPRPSSPAPVTLAQKQAAHKARVKVLSAATFADMVRDYSALLSLATSDDSAKNGLTAAQKQAALTPDERTELITNAWLLANLLNGIAPNTVPNPPAP